MKETIQTLQIAGYTCELYLPRDEGKRSSRYPVVYLNGVDQLEEIVDAIKKCGRDCDDFILLSIRPHNWGADFTPWPAPGLKKGEPPFAGGASTYLSDLFEKIKPYVDLNYPTRPERDNTALIGYSLAGLTSLYALYSCAGFGKIGCLSGSLWYDGFVAYMRAHPPACSDAKVYLSLGMGEKNSRNPLMSTVADCTGLAAEILAHQLHSQEHLLLEWNPGGHFADIPGRFAKALQWLMKTP